MFVRLERLGDSLPPHLAGLLHSDPRQYRDALLTLERYLGYSGARRLHEQIELLSGAPDHDIAAAARRRRLGLTGHGEPLSPELRRQAERSLGVGLSHVQVHRGSAAQAAALRHGAAAFAYRDEIVLGAGVDNASTALMAEEVAHVVQQRGAGDAASPTVTSPTSPAERSAHAATPAILPGKPARVGAVGRRAVMRVERDSDRAEDRNPKDLSPQLGGFESRSDEELEALVNDEESRPRYTKRGCLYEPGRAGSVPLEQWLAAYDETMMRRQGPRSKDDKQADQDAGNAYAAQGEVFADDAAGPVQRKASGPW